MKKTALVVMAAGIGSRFGGGIKQLEPVGPSGEIIMDYSIHDALEAGFNKVVFIIRKDLEKDFKEIIGNRIEKITEVEYAFQAIDNLPEGFSVPEGRTKPWGTGQAVLSPPPWLPPSVQAASPGWLPPSGSAGRGRCSGCGSPPCWA